MRLLDSFRRYLFGLVLIGFVIGVWPAGIVVAKEGVSVRSALHSSVREFDSVIFEWLTASYHLRLDSTEVGDRLALWLLPKSVHQAPDYLLSACDFSYGSSGNSVWSFLSKGLLFVVSDLYVMTDEMVPKSLAIYQSEVCEFSYQSVVILSEAVLVDLYAQ